MKMERIFWGGTGAGWNGDEAMRRRVGMELKSTAMGGDVCNFCPRAHL